MLKKITKEVTELWASSDVLSIKLHSFIVLRKIALSKSGKEIDEVFRVNFIYESNNESVIYIFIFRKLMWLLCKMLSM